MKYLASQLFWTVSLVICSLTASAQCSSCTYTLGSSGSYTVQSGTYCIPAGVTFTGTIYMNGGTLCNSGTISSSASIDSWSGGGNIYNYGQINRGGFSFSNGITFRNYGTTSINGGFQINSSSTFINEATGILQVNGNLDNNAGFRNLGSGNISGNYSSNNGSFLNENNGSIVISGSLNVNRPFTNRSELTVGGNVNVNSGGTLNNEANATLAVKGNYQNHATTNNNGLINIEQNFTNNGVYNNNKTTIVIGNFTNNKTISGAAGCNPFVVYGQNAVQNGGANISNTDMCLRGIQSGNFSTNWGTLSSVTYCTCSQGVSPLPVTLSSFTANCSDNNIEIQWITESEQNNAYFTVLRSQDAVNWEPVYITAGAGNSNTIQSYTYTDLRPLTGTASYYRLSQTDYDGTSELFAPVAISCETEVSSSSPSVLIFPNPVEDIFTVTLSLPYTTQIIIEVIELSGRKVFSEKYAAQEGENVYPINRGNWAAGTYMVRTILGSDVVDIQKIIVR